MTSILSEYDVKIIDADTHIIEPYDLWTSRVSVAKYGDLVPHVRFDPERGEDSWYSGDRLLSSATSYAMAGWHEATPKHPSSLDQVHPRLYRAEERLQLMDEYGIHAQVLYPNVPGFGSGRFVDLGDMELSELLLRAYNDWVHDFASAAPDRFLPMMALPFWDVDLSVREMRRCADLGFRGLIFSQAPDYFGQPVLSDPHWDRIWRAAEEMQLVVNFHIGSSDRSGLSMLHPSAGAAANHATVPATIFLGNCRTIATLIGGGVCHRFPDLNFVSVESGVGWLPFALESLDWMWKESAVIEEHPEYDLLPSEYFKRQIYGCFWFEHGPSLTAAIETIGADNLLYETDFPHPTSMSPGPASHALAPNEFIEQRLSHLKPTDLRKMLSENARRIYNLG